MLETATWHSTAMLVHYMQGKILTLHPLKVSASTARQSQTHDFPSVFIFAMRPFSSIQFFASSSTTRAMSPSFLMRNLTLRPPPTPEEVLPLTEGDVEALAFYGRAAARGGVHPGEPSTPPRSNFRGPNFCTMQGATDA
jgi:hypothetical protein